jgi:hypothetical protein
MRYLNSNNIKLRKLIIIPLFIIGLIKNNYSQELNCKVQIETQKISNTDKRIYNIMQTAIAEFLNNRRWTNDNFQNKERIECNILINITERPSNEQFKGTLQIQSSRPVFNTSYASPLINYLDNDISFNYVENQSLEFSDNSYSSNLTSTLGYYAYLIIGLDYDSFSLNGGSSFFQKALSIANAAQSSDDVGWKAYGNNDNRYWLISNMLDASFIPLRECMYNYHRKGLDIMYNDQELGRKTIYESLESLNKIYEIKPSSFNLKVFFTAKSDEIVNLFSSANPDEKGKIIALLNRIDASNSNKYQKILQRN